MPESDSLGPPFLDLSAKPHESLKRLVENTSAEEIMAPWLTRTTQFSGSNEYPMIHSGRVTLLGDSAHAMPPDRALGGNNVLEDARLLSTLLVLLQNLLIGQN